MIYLDSAATSFQKPPGVSQAVQNAMQSMSSPGRGAYDSGMKAADCLLDCRMLLAKMFHVTSPENVIFTHSATEGLNIAIRDLLKPGMRVMISGFEHNAVTRPLHALGADIFVAGRRLFDPESLLHQIRHALHRIDLVVCTHTSNVFGYILPMDNIAELCRQEGIPFIVDASQSAGILPIDFDRWGADYCAMPGHKGLLGPQGTGVLLCRHEPMPLLFGGTGSDSANPEMPEYLPDRLEAGTHNVPGIAGLRFGLQWLAGKKDGEILLCEQELMRSFVRNIDGIGNLQCFYTDTPALQSGVVSLRINGMDSETIAARLAEKGIAVRAGLHCAPLAHQSAGTISGGTVRFSFSPFNTNDEVLEAARILREITA